MAETLIDTLTEDQRWTAVEQRDKSTTGQFVYAVKTTGIYCRPGCSSRLPRRLNVSFFDNPRLARLAGFRACKRCRPDQDEADLPHAEAIRIACELIEQAEQPPTLDQLAAAVDYSPAHFQRLFKESLGVTPKAYAATRRAHRVRESLRHESSVTAAVYSAGYSAPSRFYDESTEVLGMKPSEYRDGAKGVSIRVAVTPTSLGMLLVAATERGLCAIELGDSEDELLSGFRERFPAADVDTSPSFKAMVSDVAQLVDQQRPDISLPLDIQGTAFQRQVWEALRAIPTGTTTTYTELANKIGRPKAVRAVASACAANKLAIVIPCHRVIRSDGHLGGYRWGIERKEALLEREKS